MRLTTRGRYAVTAMVDLALRGDQGPVALATISRRQHISQSYLEQLFGGLRRRELVRSFRGPGGGYLLQRGAEGITVAEIIAAVDETFEDDGGPRLPASHDARQGAAQALWASLEARMRQHLASISLRDLVEDHMAAPGAR